MTDTYSHTERLQRLNRLHKLLNDTSRAIVRAGTEAELFAAVCQIAVQTGQLLMAAVVGLDHETGVLKALAHGGDEDGYFADISLHVDDERLRHGTSATAIRTGRPAVCNDLVHAPEMEPLQPHTSRRGFQSCTACPLAVGGVPFGAFVVFAGEVDYFQPDEIDLLSTVAQDISYAVGHLRAERARRDAQASLATADHLLGQKNALLRIAGKLAQFGGWALDHPSQRVFWSDEVFAILEFEHRKLPPFAQLLELYPMPDRERIVQAIETCLLAGTPFDLEVDIRTGQGRLICARVCGEARHAADGSIDGVQGAFQDVSVRKQQDQAQLRSERRFRQLFDHSVDGVLLTRPDGTVLSANRSACAIFGMDEEAIRAAGRAGLVDTTDPRLAELLSARQRDGTARGELRMRRAGNQLFEADISSAAFGVEGAADQTLTGIFVRDVTERNQAAKLQQTQLMHMALMHRITTAIGDRLAIDSVFQVVADSIRTHLPADVVALARLNSVARNAVVGHVSAADGASRLPTLFEGAVMPATQGRLGRCAGGELVHEPDLERMNEPLMNELSAAGLRSVVLAPLQSDGEVFALMVIARAAPGAFSADDRQFVAQLSEHVQLAVHQARLHEALRQAYLDLGRSQQAMLQQERLRAAGQMASGAAHDINNAISPVALYTEALLESEPGLSSRGRGYLETIQRAIGDVASTVGRMREFSRPREVVANTSPVSLNLLVSQVVELTRVRWRDMPHREGVSVSLSAEPDHDLPDIVATEGDLRQALTNLVFNAVDAVPHGGSVVVRTGVHGTADGSRQAFVEVQDDGVGMDEQTRRRCLEPFFTTKGERGSGLGLAMVYGSVQRHGGDIRIESAPGRGTTVRLLFPVMPEPQVGPSVPHPAHADLPTARALRVLIVDDEPLVLASLENILRMDGHDVVSAGGGQAGIELFRSALEQARPYQVVITDLGMPHVDGRQLAAAVKAGSPQTPVILLTGWGQHIADEGEQIAHVDQVLGKPPRLAEVRAALGKHVMATMSETPGDFHA